MRQNLCSICISPKQAIFDQPNRTKPYLTNANNTTPQHSTA